MWTLHKAVGNRFDYISTNTIRKDQLNLAGFSCKMSLSYTWILFNIYAFITSMDAEVSWCWEHSSPDKCPPTQFLSCCPLNRIRYASLWWGSKANKRLNPKQEEVIWHSRWYTKKRKSNKFRLSSFPRFEISCLDCGFNPYYRNGERSFYWEAKQ